MAGERRSPLQAGHGQRSALPVRWMKTSSRLGSPSRASVSLPPEAPMAWATGATKAAASPWT